MKIKLSWHFFAVCLIVINVTATVYAYYSRNEEYAYEMADLQAMRCAEELAQATWYDTLPTEPVKYWFDAANYSLILESDPKPAPYGMGTKRYGGAVKSFQKETNLFFQYNESEDYRGKILLITADKDAGQLTVGVNWVDAE